jgi:hypothetical protein
MTGMEMNLEVEIESTTDSEIADIYLLESLPQINIFSQIKSKSNKLSYKFPFFFKI